MKISKRAALLGIFAVALFSACTQRSMVDTQNMQHTASLLPPPSSSSSSQVSSEEEKIDWTLSAIARKEGYAQYMTIEQYDALFGTGGMMPGSPVPSPDGGSILYFYPDEFEERSALFRYDLAGQTAQCLLSQEDIGQSQSIKWIDWQQDGSLLLIIGYRYGTISPGGAVYLLTIDEAPALRLLYATRKETEQVLDAQLTGDTLSMTVAVFDEAFMDYTKASRSVTVDPANAPVAQLTGIKDAPENALAVIYNDPTAEQMAPYPNLDVYDHDQNGEWQLVVPVREGTRVTLETLTFDEASNQFVAVDAVYDKVSGAGQALLIHLLHPEGEPRIRLTAAYGEDAAQYYISYHGKEGNSNSEYITYP